MPEVTPQTVSLKMDSFVKGGLIQDVDLYIKSLHWVVWDYEGKGQKTLAVKAEMEVVGDGSPVDQYWSAGDHTVFAPAEGDDKRLIRLKDKEGLADSTNFFLFRKSLHQHGFPDDKVTDSLACFEGMIFHGIRAAQPKREGLEKEKKEGDRTPTVLIASAIIAMPWEKQKISAALKKGQSTAPKSTRDETVAKPNGPVPAAASTTEAPTVEGNVEEIAIRVLTELLNEAEGKELDRGRVKVEAFRRLVKIPAVTRNEVGKLITSEEWIKAHENLAPGLLMMATPEKLVLMEG